MTNITYCTNADCNFKDCQRHIKNIPNKQKQAIFSDVYKVCDRYIRSLLDEVSV